MSHIFNKLVRGLRPSFLLLTALSLTLTTAGFGCKTVDKSVLERTKPLTIKFWCVFDNQEFFQPIFSAYTAQHPNVSFDYRKLTYEEYEKELLNAMSEDRGPDIMCLHNTWMRQWQDRLLPAPAVLSVVNRSIVGTLKKEVVYNLVNKAGATPKQVQNDFIDAVGEDAVLPTEQADPRLPLVPRVYGLPVATDALVLYYNRDLLNAVGIPQPATYWNDFQDQIKKLTKLDELGTIIQSGAALGTSVNVERSSDVLALLMMQNGTPMFSSEGQCTFNQFSTETVGQPLPPGAVAMVFYNDFANPEKEVYTWNAKMPGSFEAFVSGRTAYFFGYNYHLAAIRDTNPKLNFGIAPFPQISGNRPMNFANYWLNAVSKKTKNVNEVWDFLQFMTSAEQSQSYLAVTRKPTAHRNLVNSQLEDLDLSVFAASVPTAHTWYRGHDVAAAEQSMNDMITQMTEADADPIRIIELGSTKVNQTVE